MSGEVRSWAVATVGDGAYTVWRRTGPGPSFDLTPFSLSAGPPEGGPGPKIAEVVLLWTGGESSHRLSGRDLDQTGEAAKRALTAFLVRLQGDVSPSVSLATAFGIPRPIDETLLEIMTEIRPDADGFRRGSDGYTAIKGLASALSSRIKSDRDRVKVLMPPGHSPFDPWAVDEQSIVFSPGGTRRKPTVKVEWTLGSMGDLGDVVLAEWEGRDAASAVLTREGPLILLPRRDHEVWLSSLPPVVDLWPSEMYDLLGKVGPSSPLFAAPEDFDEWAERVGLMSRPG